MTLNTVTGDGTVKEIISSANFQIDNMVSYKTGVASEAVKGLSEIGNLTRCCILAHPPGAELFYEKNGCQRNLQSSQ